MSYLPYSTYRRPHAPSVASAATIGNVASREQLYAMAQMLRQRACRTAKQVREGRHRVLLGGSGQCPTDWHPPFKIRVLGEHARLNFTDQNWILPGARFLGMALVAFRSE